MPVDTVLVDMVRDELRRISDTGALASRAQLREAVGLGAGDLEAALGELREAGEATEVEPDGYRLVSGPEELDTDEARAARAEEAEEAPARGDVVMRRTGPHTLEHDAADVTVTLTMKIAKAVGEQGLGNLVVAGIEEAEALGVPFVLEIQP